MINEKAIKAATSGKSVTINSTIGAAPVSVILIWLLGKWGVEMPPEVAAAVVAIIMGVLGVIMRFITTKSLEDKMNVE